MNTDTNTLTERIYVPVRLRDGGVELLKCSRWDNDKHNLYNALVHPFTHKSGAVILYILEDGTGEKIPGKSGEPGKSLPALITGQPNKFGYLTDDMFDITAENIDSRRDR